MSPLQLYPALALAAVLAAGGFYKYGHHVGWGERDAEVQLEIARKNDEARAREQALAAQLHANSTKLKETNDALDKKSSALDRAIRAGRVRLPAASCAPPAASAAAEPGNRDEARGKSDGAADAAVDSERETLALIAQIAADGDRAINQLNACIDAYNQVREQINGSNR